MTAENANDAPVTELGGDLGLALGLVYRSFSGNATQVLEKLPSGTRGYHVLSEAIRGRAGSQAELAERLGVNRTVMTHLVDDLEALKLVERQADSSDRRNRIIVATARGRRLWTTVQRQLREVEQEVLGVLGPEDQLIFCRLLGRLAAKANQAEPTDDACVVGQEIEAQIPVSPGK